MKNTHAQFSFYDKAIGQIHVDFYDGHDLVRIVRGGEVHKIANPKLRYGGRAYKPCMSHCLELIRQLSKKPPTNNFAKRRLKEQRPALKLVRD